AGIGVLLRGDGTDVASALVALLAGVGYVASSLLARGFGVRVLGPDEAGRPVPLAEDLRAVAAGLVAGARHLLARRPAAAALAAMTVHRLCFGATTLITLLAYRNLFVDPPGGGLLKAGLPGLTQVVVASGAGTLLGAVLTPLVARRISPQLWITGLLAGAAAVELGFGLPYQELTFLLAGFALGVVSQGTKISVDTLVQRSVDDAFRGRVFSVYDTLFNVAFVAAAALAAAVLPPDGVSRPLLVALAVLYAVGAAGYAYASRAELLRRPAPRSPATGKIN
ncbi:MAG: hypothetical protein QOG60_1566, partial [Frankiaceae bacterium]|nr:hypothetical protein [Frankiaceae bacterium]